MHMHGYPKGKTAKYVVQVKEVDGWHDITYPLTNRGNAFRLRNLLNAQGKNQYRVFNNFTHRESLDTEQTSV